VASRATVSAVAAAILALSAASSADAAEPLDLSLDKHEPRCQQVPLSGGRCGSGLCGDGSIFCRLAGSFKGRSRGSLARHDTSRRHPIHDELHLQLSPLRAEFAHLAGTSPT
jgi:hypothetical protein